MANAESGLDRLATMLAESLGAAVARGDGGLTPGNASQETGGSQTPELEARAVGQVAATSSEANTSGNSALSAIGSTAASVVETALGLGPLISGLERLFGGGGSATTTPALTSYTAPESVAFEGDVYRGANVTDWGGSGGAHSGTPLPASTQITVQVNAMDSQSFLDHSQDIANAVRQAMLNSNSLNDVVSDL